MCRGTGAKQKDYPRTAVRQPLLAELTEGV